jgi:PPM family protein phosphatase
MPIDAVWISQTGRRTADNRDYAGVGIRSDDALCIVLDGSSTGEDSGQFARDITQALIDWFVAAKEPVTAQAVTDQLREIHGATCRRYSRASASYMAAYVTASGDAVVLHAGDCLLGSRRAEGSMSWLSRPHTLANIASDVAIAAIAAVPARHRLTRSFRAREFLLPEVLTTNVGEELVIMTDGFWADLSEREQALFIGGGDVAMPDDGDDRSVLVIRSQNGPQSREGHCAGESAGNLYVKAEALTP